MLRLIVYQCLIYSFVEHLLIYRVTICLENLEMSGNLLTVGELSGSKPCHGKGFQKLVIASCTEVTSTGN